MAELLLIEDNPHHRKSLARVLRHAGFRVTAQENSIFADEALAKSNGILAQAAILDDPETLRRLRAKPLIILDWNADIRQAVHAMKLGVADYLAAPPRAEELIDAVNDALAVPARHPSPVAGAAQPFPLMGSSDAIRALRSRIQRVAATDIPVLIQGELGTGKALVARALHTASKRDSAPFNTVNCAAVPESLIERELFGTDDMATSAPDGRLAATAGGTLFLDEVGELSLAAQARLLQFLANRASTTSPPRTDTGSNVRIMVASQLDLKLLTDQGRFRDDLYYRLDVVSLTTPPLRARGQDIPDLADHILTRVSGLLGKPRPALAASAREAIASYGWPGNIRELENVLERAAILCNGHEIDRSLLAIDTRAAEASNTAKAGSENISLEEYFLRFVRENEDHLTETEMAEKLGISRKSLWERRQRFGIPRRKTRKRGPRRA